MTVTTFTDNVVLSPGKIGIGTISPTCPLHVVGNGEGSPMYHLPASPVAVIVNAGESKIEFTDTKHNQVWQVGTSDQGYQISEVSPPVWLAHLVIQKGTGNVGIGTTKPSGKLDVQGDICVKNQDGKDTIRLGAADASIGAGGPMREGYLLLNNKAYQPMIRLDAHDASLAAGGLQREGYLLLNDKNYQPTVRLDAHDASIGAGGPIREGYLLLNDKNYAPRIRLDAADASIGAGGAGIAGKVVIRNGVYTDMVTIDGATGDVVLHNADCAEDFDIPAIGGIEPGSVMVIGAGGGLCQSTQAYDKRVAGVISGAGDYKPGMVLDRQASQTNRMPVSLMGKVYCKADAQYAPIEVGDLLTTSPTLGHAMKATDPLKAFGAVLGKALRPLSEGTGLIPILIALQ